jgi:hypothetical protein
MTPFDGPTRTRIHESRDDNPGPAAAPASGAGSLMGRARESLRAGDDAIEQALSGDPALFLSSARQLSGQ